MKRTPLKRKTPLKGGALKTKSDYLKAIESIKKHIPEDSTEPQYLVVPKTLLKRAKRPLRASKPKKKAKTITKVKKALWDECRRITRERYGNTCYTCGRTGLEGSNWQTGHFISSSICSVFLRYHLDNLRPQCYNCNINKSGNWIAFEAHLIADGIDPETLKRLNRETTGRQYDIIYYEEKLKEYQQL